MSRLLHQILSDLAESSPDAIALVDGKREFAYSDLDGQCRQFARGLTELGVGRFDRVAIYLPKQLEMVLAVFGTSLTGGIFVPVNPLLKPEQVVHILNDCNAKILVTAKSRITLLKDALADCPDLESVIVVDGESDAADSSYRCVGPEVIESSTADLPANGSIDVDVASILYTSGSTGKPKGVVLSHRNMVCGAESVANYLENSADDTILAVLPFSFDAGFSQLTTGLSVGAKVVLLNYLLPKDVVRAAEKHRATGLTGVPPLWNQLALLDWPDTVVESMRYIANTGGAMPTTTLDALRQRLPKTAPYLMYGLTEAFRSTYLPPDQVDTRPTSIGKAIPNAEILVVNDDGDLCQPGEPGELVHRGALVALGYWNDPERTKERYKPLPTKLSGVPTEELAVWSGDIVKSDEEGFLYFVGRRDDMIKSSGYRISPTEVEDIVYQSGAVEECAAIGIPDPLIGQAVVVVCRPKADCEEPADTIKAACKKHLPAYMVPAHVLCHDALPRNPNGKIDRRKISAELDTEALTA